MLVPTCQNEVSQVFEGQTPLQGHVDMLFIGERENLSWEELANAWQSFCMYGYDAGVLGGVQTTRPFLEAMGHPTGT